MALKTHAQGMAKAWGDLPRGKWGQGSDSELSLSSSLTARLLCADMPKGGPSSCSYCLSMHFAHGMHERYEGPSS